MTLQLNDKLPFKGYYGRNIDQMPWLIKDGRIPLSVAGLMQQRLDALTASTDVKSAWWDNYFGTGDAILYQPNGKIKVVLDSNDLRNITQQSKLANGALVLPHGAYDAAKGVEFSRDDILTGTPLTQEETKNHPVWNALARNRVLLNDYVDVAFEQGKRSHYDANMGVYLRETPNQAVLRLCTIYGTGHSLSLEDNGHLDDFKGCFVGVAPERK